MTNRINASIKIYLILRTTNKGRYYCCRFIFSSKPSFTGSRATVYYNHCLSIRHFYKVCKCLYSIYRFRHQISKNHFSMSEVDLLRLSRFFLIALENIIPFIYFVYFNVGLIINFKIFYYFYCNIFTSHNIGLLPLISDLISEREASTRIY